MSHFAEFSHLLCSLNRKNQTKKRADELWREWCCRNLLHLVVTHVRIEKVIGDGGEKES